MDFTDESDHPVAASNPSHKRIRDFDDEGNDDDEDMEEEEVVLSDDEDDEDEGGNVDDNDNKGEERTAPFRAGESPMI